jgi:hypothetical protein
LKEKRTPLHKGRRQTSHTLDTSASLFHCVSACVALILRRGYRHCIAQGDNWINVASVTMALLQPPGLLAIHINRAATVPADISKALAKGGPAPGCRQRRLFVSDQAMPGYERWNSRAHRSAAIAWDEVPC